jgi:hypothetical protein
VAVCRGLAVAISAGLVVVAVHLSCLAAALSRLEQCSPKATADLPD